MKNLITRALTGLVFVLIIVGAIVLSPYSFIGLFAIITAFMLYEYYSLVKTHYSQYINIPLNILGGVILFLCTASYAMNVTDNKIFFLYIFFIMLTLIVGLYKKTGDPIIKWALSISGQIYIALPISLLNFIAFKDASEIELYNYIPLLSLFIFIWLNDTGAYLIGSSIGKHRLFERISPKKSWEGFFGGLIFSIIGGYVFSRFFPIFNMYEWIGMALVVSAFSTWGDLTESLLKRTLGVKDSGNIFPGHGGFLDRFDSVLIAGPAVLIYIYMAVGC